MINPNNEIRRLTKTIANLYQPTRIILFGSMARGDYKKCSDIDLLIIKKSEKKRPFRVKEIFEAIRGLKRNFSLDLIVYTPEEIKKRLTLGDFFINRIFHEGKTIYDQTVSKIS